MANTAFLEHVAERGLWVTLNVSENQKMGPIILLELRQEVKMTEERITIFSWGNTDKIPKNLFREQKLNTPWRFRRIEIKWYNKYYTSLGKVLLLNWLSTSKPTSLGTSTHVSTKLIAVINDLQIKVINYIIANANWYH